MWYLCPDLFKWALEKASTVTSTKEDVKSPLFINLCRQDVSETNEPILMKNGTQTRFD